MGCDIHLYVEKKVKGKWVPCDIWGKDKYWEEGEPLLSVDYDDYFYNGRNYSLFAILADVRNNYGFVGCDGGEKFNIIAKPKGLPNNISSNVKRMAESWGSDDHSHSWFTLKELRDFDWEQEATLRGYISLEAYIKWVRDGKPHLDSCCGNVSGGKVVKVEESAVGNVDFGMVDVDVYVHVEWKESYRSCCPAFLNKTLPRLEELGKPEDVRIVFWFDN